MRTGGSSAFRAGPASDSSSGSMMGASLRKGYTPRRQRRRGTIGQALRAGTCAACAVSLPAIRCRLRFPEDMRIPPFLKVRPASVTWPVRAELLFTAYFVIAKLGLRFATIGESISPVWPPTGFAIAALLLLGWRYWPAILAGAFLANATTHVPPLAAAAIACGNAGEALVGAYLMRGRVQLDEPGAVRNLVLFAAPGAALVSAVTGVSALAVTGALPTGGFLSAFGLWWAGDVVGALTVAPLILSWAAPSRSFMGRRTLLEMVALAIGCVLLSLLLLGRLLTLPFMPPSSYPYLLFPLVIAAAVRAGPRGAAITTAMVALVAVGGAAQGGGPFAL